MKNRPTLERVKKTIDRYIFEQDDPIVLAITGGWGEGKTYFWKENIVPEYADKRPGYVSVFGAESIGAIRERVLVAAGEAFDVREKSISDVVKDRFPWVRQVGHVLAGIGKHWSGVIGIPSSVVDQLMESTLLRDGWIICIDDVERLSEKVGTDTFLGYVNELREEHKLRVVLIFNDDWFEGQEDKSFERFREKVIDREVPFIPDLREIVQLVAPDELLASGEEHKKLVSRCEILGLRNIRILGKAIRFFDELVSKLPENADASFCDAALHSLLLFSWMRFSPEKTVQFGDLETYSVLGRSMERHARASVGQDDDEEDEVEKLLSSYGYQFTDDLDLILIDFVQNGVLNEVALIEEYEKYSKKISRGLLEEQFRNTWKEHFHGSLSDNSEVFCGELITATEKYLPYGSVEQIDSVLNVLEKLGHGKDAERLFGAFMEARPDYYREYQEMSSFSEPIRYGLMKNAIEQSREEEQRDERSLNEVLESAWEDEFISQPDRVRLAEFSGEEVAEFLLNNDTPSITTKLRNFYRLTLHANTEEDLQIRAAITEAIEIISGRSTINRLRMEAMGLVRRALPDDDTDNE